VLGQAAAQRNDKGEIVGYVGTITDITDRRKAEDEKNRLLKAIEMTAAAISVVTPDRIMAYANAAMNKLFGYKEGELIGKSASILNAGPLQKAEELARQISEAAEKNGIWDGEICNKRKDGSEFISYAGVSAVKDRNGRVVSFVSTQHDVTERKKAEDALRNAKDYAENLIQTANAIVVGLDTNGKIQVFNNAAEKITGYTRNELEGRNWFEVIVPRDRYPYVWEEFQRLMVSGILKNLENPILTKNGEERYIAWQNNEVREQGRIVGTVSFGIDITERKKAEEAFKKSEEKYRCIVETANEGICVVDSNDFLTFVNKKFTCMLGYEPQEIIGKHVKDFIFPEDLPDHRVRMEERRRGKTGFYERRLRHKDGTARWFQLSGTPLQDSQGRFAGSFTMTTDITERKQAEEEIKNLAKFPEENSNPVYRTSKDGVLLYANPASRRLILLEGQIKIGDKIPEKWIGMIKNVYDSGKKQRAEIELGGRVFLFDQVPVIEGGYVNSYATDITERKQAEEKLRLRLHCEKGLADFAKVLLSGFKSEHVLTDALRYLQQACGASRVYVYQNMKDPDKGLCMCHISEVCAEGVLSRLANPTLQCSLWADKFSDWMDELSKGNPIVGLVKDFPQHQREVLESQGTISVLILPIHIGQYWYGFIGFDDTFGEKQWIHEDIGLLATAADLVGMYIGSRQTVGKLLAYQNKLRTLALKLIETEEHERRHIAAGLHDDIIQPLIFLKIKLDLLRKSATDRKLVDSFGEMIAVIDELTAETRNFTFELSCPILHEMGLEAAIENLLDTEIQAKHHIETVFKKDDKDKPLDINMSTFLFKAVRELLTNMVKHAKASRVVVSVTRDNGRVVISVEDNGIGFEPFEGTIDVVKPTGFGLFNIRERLDILGGSLSITSKPGQGTKVVIEAPLSKKLKESRYQNGHKDNGS